MKTTFQLCSMQKLFLLSLLVLCTNMLFAQSLTQQFTFSQSDLSFNQYKSYDVVAMPETANNADKTFAGHPQLPIKSFNLLLPQGAKANQVSITSFTQENIAEKTDQLSII